MFSSERGKGENWTPLSDRDDQLGTLCLLASASDASASRSLSRRAIYR
jgi:hypothetical protein